LIGEHAREVRRPNATSEGGRGDHDGESFGVSALLLCPMDQAGGAQTRQRRKHRGHEQEPPIVLIR